MNPNQNYQQETVLHRKVHEYIVKTSNLYLSQDLRSNGYDLINPSQELRIVMDTLVAEIEVMFKTERIQEISDADNRIKSEFGEDFLAFRDVRLKELADDRNQIRAISSLGE